jgi:hypothetical protein
VADGASDGLVVGANVTGAEDGISDAVGASVGS